MGVVLIKWMRPKDLVLQPHHCNNPCKLIKYFTLPNHGTLRWMLNMIYS